MIAPTFTEARAEARHRAVRRLIIDPELFTGYTPAPRFAGEHLGQSITRIVAENA